MFRVGDTLIVTRLDEDYPFGFKIGDVFKCEEVNKCDNTFDWCTNQRWYHVCPKETVNKFCSFRFSNLREEKLKRILKDDRSK